MAKSHGAFKAIGQVLKNKTIVKRILFTLFAFLIYKIATYITLPLINSTSIAGIIGNDDGFLGIANAMTGNALQQFSIIALGIGPYITASIIVQLLQMDIVPLLKEWTEQGDVGKQKANQLTRYIAIGMAFIQGIAMTFGFKQTGNAIFATGVQGTFLDYIYIAIVMTAGTAFLLWLSDQITLHGAGNGSSMIICAGIISSMPQMISSLVSQYFTSTSVTTDYVKFGGVMITFILIIVGVTIMQAAIRKIPVQYANRPTSSKLSGKNDSSIPIKLNSAGVIPVIFAVTLLSIPQYVINIVPNMSSSFSFWFNQIFTYTEPIGYVIYVLLIFVFAFFYSFVQINPEKMAKNLDSSNAYIPGVRPGVETENYISRVLFKVTVIGAIYLVVVASLPILMTILIADLPSGVRVGGTSLLIVVGVAIQTTQQLYTDAKEQNYSGFIKE